MDKYVHNNSDFFFSVKNVLFKNKLSFIYNIHCSTFFHNFFFFNLILFANLPFFFSYYIIFGIIKKYDLFKCVHSFEPEFFLISFKAQKKKKKSF